MDSLYKVTQAPVRDAHPDSVPSTEYDSLKNVEEIEMILLEYNEEYLNLNEKWNDLRKFNEESQKMATRIAMYKEVIIDELQEIETESKLLMEAIKNADEVYEQCKDILDLDCALPGIDNRVELVNERRKTCSSKICEIRTLSVDGKSSEKGSFRQDLIEEVRDSHLFIDSAEASGFAQSADEGHEDVSREESVLTEEKNLNTEEKKDTQVLFNLKKILEGENEVEKLEKPNKECSRHLRERVEIIEQNCMDETRNIECAATPSEIRASMVRNSTDLDNFAEVKKKPTTKLEKGEEQIERNIYSSESLSSDAEDSTGDVPDKETLEHVPDVVQLANQLKKAIAEHEQARGEVIKETVNKMKKLRREEIYLKKKLDKLMSDYLTITQENDDAAMLMFDKNITGVKSKLNVIDCNVKFVKMESDHKIARIKLNFELEALAERLQLAKAIELLAELREQSTAQVTTNILENFE